MFTEEMNETYTALGYPVGRLVKASGREEWRIIKAMEHVFDMLYCYEPIQLPWMIFFFADQYEQDRDYVKEQAELKSAQYWRNKAEFNNAKFKAVSTLLFLILFLMVIEYV